MERREFVQRGATLAGAAALFGLDPLEADAAEAPERKRELAPEFAWRRNDPRIQALAQGQAGAR